MQTQADRTDDELMAQLASGELDASAALFRRYQNNLYGFFLRMGFAADAAEDLVQEVFERLIRYRQSYRTGMPFRAWIYQIARNVRTDRRLRRTELALPDQAEAADEPWQDTEERLAQLEWALQRLPEDQLEILLLTRYQRLKYTEVGVLLGCSEGAVKLKVFRALQQLRAIYFRLEKI